MYYTFLYLVHKSEDLVHTTPSRRTIYWMSEMHCWHWSRLEYHYLIRLRNQLQRISWLRRRQNIEAYFFSYTFTWKSISRPLIFSISIYMHTYLSTYLIPMTFSPSSIYKKSIYLSSIFTYPSAFLIYPFPLSIYLSICLLISPEREKRPTTHVIAREEAGESHMQIRKRKIRKAHIRTIRTYGLLRPLLRTLSFAERWCWLPVLG